MKCVYTYNRAVYICTCVLSIKLSANLALDTHNVTPLLSCDCSRSQCLANLLLNIPFHPWWLNPELEYSMDR